MKTNKPGYILILTFFFIGLSIVLITGILKQASNFQKNVALMRNKEKAKILSLSGIQLALDQLSLVAEDESSEENSSPKAEGGEEKKKQAFLAKWFIGVFPLLNKWNTITLTQAAFGIDGSINYFISCEQGKIDLNNFANILEKESKQATQTAKVTTAEGKSETLAGVDTKNIKSFTSVIDQLVKKEFKVNLIEALNEAKSSMPLEDPAQLLKYKAFESAKNKLFLPFESVRAPKKMPLTLMDLFTTMPSSGKLNAWFLSYSMAQLLGMQRKPDANAAEIGKKFKPQMDWEKEWDKTLAEFYGKSFKSLPSEVTAMFSQECEANAFSVIVYAKVGPMIQRLCALLERENPKKIARENIIYKITKIFWF